MINKLQKSQNKKKPIKKLSKKAFVVASFMIALAVMSKEKKTPTSLAPKGKRVSTRRAKHN